MMICSVSMDQALGIWSDLWRAYYRDHGFGTDTAEVYAYRLVGHQPVWCQVPLPKTPGDPDTMQRYSWEAGMEARRNLGTLLDAFMTAAGCEIEVDGMPLRFWSLQAEPFLLSCLVRVIRREEK